LETLARTSRAVDVTLVIATDTNMGAAGRGVGARVGACGITDSISVNAER
jgi:hypothetical protein